MDHDDVWCAGYFQPEEGQFGCMNCDILGNVYQEHEAQTFCTFCAAHTQRYVGVLSARNRSSCQCKEGGSTTNSRHLLFGGVAVVCAGYYTPNAQAGEVRSGLEYDRSRKVACD